MVIVFAAHNTNAFGHNWYADDILVACFSNEF